MNGKSFTGFVFLSFCFVARAGDCKVVSGSGVVYRDCRAVDYGGGPIVSYYGRATYPAMVPGIATTVNVRRTPIHVRRAAPRPHNKKDRIFEIMVKKHRGQTLTLEEQAIYAMQMQEQEEAARLREVKNKIRDQEILEKSAKQIERQRKEIEKKKKELADKCLKGVCESP